MANVLIYSLMLMVFADSIQAESCIKCDSKTDPKCATNPIALMPQECGNNSSDCYIRVGKDGETIRGCSFELDRQANETCAQDVNACRRCIGVNGMAGCNNEIFPYHRPACHQCTGKLNDTADNVCAVNSQIESVTCPLYDHNDKCYIWKSLEKDEVRRGCLSSAGVACKNQSLCYICEGHGCNHISAFAPNVPDSKDFAPIVYANSAIFLLTGFLLARVF